jgi:hypothetical protein
MNLKNDLSEIISRARDAVRRARLSRIELVFLAAAILFASAVALFYSYKVAPLSFAVAARRQEIKELKARIDDLNVKEKKRLAQAANAEKIMESLHGFETRLKSDESGMTQIINEIDTFGATRKVLVGDSTYRVEEADAKFDENGNPKPQPNRDKKPKIYPNLGVETTVIGDYSNLRLFLSDLERSKQFLIVNSLAFQGGDERLTRQLARVGKQPQLSAGAVPVSLKIEFDTYFQPPRAGVQTAQAAPKDAR